MSYERVYNCHSCVNKAVCKDNSASRHQCIESINKTIAQAKSDRRKMNKRYKLYIKSLKQKIKEIK